MAPCVRRWQGNWKPERGGNLVSKVSSCLQEGKISVRGDFYLQRLRNKGKSDVICTSEVWGQKIQGHKNCPRDASQSPEPVRSRLVAGCDSGKTPEPLVLPSYFPRQLWEGYQIMTWKRVVNQRMALISDPNCTGRKSTLIDPGLTLQTHPSVHTPLAHDELLILQIQTLENNL